MGSRHAAGLQLPQFLHEFGDIQRHAVADDVGGVGIEDSGGELVQGEFTVVADDGVPGVGAALKADDYVGCFREHIGNLAFALVAPVGADDRFDHKNSSCIFGLRSSFQDMLLYPKVPRYTRKNLPFSVFLWSFMAEGREISGGLWILFSH